MNSNTGHLPAIGQIFHACRLYRQVEMYKLSDDESEESIQLICNSGRSYLYITSPSPPV